MRVTVLGGTRFIGVAVVKELLAAGHEVSVAHRGVSERDDAPQAPHVHVDRHDRDGLRAALKAFRAEAVVDTNAYTRADAEDALAALDGRAAVVLSSCDVYRAFATLLADASARAGAGPTDAVPLSEDAAMRGPQQRYLFRGEIHPAGVDTQDYENLDVEDVVLQAGATVLRLGVVYGARDPVRREEFILRRVRAGRRQIPFGTGTFLWSRCWVRDVAVAVRLALETGAGAGQALNVAEPATWSMQQWAREILAAAGSDAELVRVPDTALPDDLALTGAVAQHVLIDSTRTRTQLGWSTTDPTEALQASVAWHLAHPPPGATDLAADDHALTQN